MDSSSLPVSLLLEEYFSWYAVAFYASCCGKGGGRRTESKNHWDERLRRSEQKNYDYKSYGVAKFSDGAVAADCEYVLSEDDNNRI
mmetsp:Transcript_6437/g.13946  ORF Transcript_6437/g.13946 Transcript_6437/m.13946 type:complete len:86 (+) Transcript_6437:18-275(+)